MRDLALVVESNQTLANHQVPQGDAPAEDGAGSLTPFGMTISSSHTPSLARVEQCAAGRIRPESQNDFPKFFVLSQSPKIFGFVRSRLAANNVF